MVLKLFMLLSFDVQGDMPREMRGMRALIGGNLQTYRWRSRSPTPDQESPRDSRTKLSNQAIALLPSLPAHPKAAAHLSEAGAGPPRSPAWAHLLNLPRDGANSARSAVALPALS